MPHQPAQKCPWSRSAPAWVAAACALGLFAGCKKSAVGTSPAAASALAAEAIVSSCDKRAVLSQCSDYGKGALAVGEKFLKGPCSALRGNYGSAPCAAKGLVGSCAVGASELRRFYGEGANLYDAARAKRECATAEGAWLDPALSFPK